MGTLWDILRCQYDLWKSVSFYLSYKKLWKMCFNFIKKSIKIYNDQIKDKKLSLLYISKNNLNFTNKFINSENIKKYTYII